MGEFARHAAGLAFLSILSGSCATVSVERAEVPPGHIAVHIYGTTRGHGFVYRQAYFTEAQVLDRRWEVRRRETMDRIRMCPRYRIIRRDIRWYEPTPESGQRCAAVVYTAWCDGTGRHDRARLDAARIEALRQDVDARPIGANCGDKDPASVPEEHLPTPEERHAETARHWEEMLSPAASCGGADTETSGAIHVLPETRIHIETLVHPRFFAALPDSIGPEWLRQAPMQVTSGFYHAGRVEPQVRSTPIADDGVNIFVTQEFALGPDGRSYCVQLSARQGARLWRRTVVRPGFVEERKREVGLDSRGRSRDPSRYWSPGLDGGDLARLLGDYLLSHAAPDRDFRRGWRW